MKPTPLKNKREYGHTSSCLHGQDKDLFDAEDVRLAVQWLKKEWKETWSLGKQQEKLIDEAFEDVIEEKA